MIQEKYTEICKESQNWKKEKETSDSEALKLKKESQKWKKEKETSDIEALKLKKGE